MNVNKIILHLSKFEVAHQKEAEDSCVVHYFYRILPKAVLGGHTVVGHLETRAGETEIPTKEAEALYRRLWLFQEYPEV